jgi:uncharacterized protein YdeI (YjbR/CyaY-like superfamily)
MGKKDPRIDAYIAKQWEFAKPILAYLRDVIHEGCPECEETLKWSSPTFMHHGMLCGFAGFKEHAIFGFWKHELVFGPNASRERVAGSFGRLTGVDDLPPKRVLLAWIKKAKELDENGVKAPRMRKGPKRAIPLPRDLKAAFAKNKQAKATYDAFSPSHQREYLEWITGAKADETRKRRLDQAVEWMSEGKSRNWKYM